MKTARDFKIGNPPDKGNSELASAMRCLTYFDSAPFDLTTSYGKGTAKGPKAIVEASHQLDLYDQAFETPYMVGIKVSEENQKIVSLNSKYLDSASRVISAMEGEGELNEADLKQLTMHQSK